MILQIYLCINYLPESQSSLSVTKFFLSFVFLSLGGTPLDELGFWKSFKSLSSRYIWSYQLLKKLHVRNMFVYTVPIKIFLWFFDWGFSFFHFRIWSYILYNLKWCLQCWLQVLWTLTGELEATQLF